MQFEVNNEAYFLNFISETGRWFVFKPTRLGIEAMPVVDNDKPLFLVEQVEVDTEPEKVN